MCNPITLLLLGEVMKKVNLKNYQIHIMVLDLDYKA